MLGVRGASWLTLLVLTAFAYHALAGYGASTGTTGDVTEDLLFEPTQNSPGMIFVLTAWMLWHRRHLLCAWLGEKPRWVAASAFFAIAGVLHLWAHYVEALDLTVVSLSALLLATGALLAGTRGARSMLRPAMLLLFAIPIPSVILNQTVYPLQLFTAQVANGVLHVLGIPSVVFGDQILTDNRIFHVIETCAGLRGMVTLTMAALVYIEIFERRGPQAILLFLSAPLVGIFVNNIRVLSIVFNPYSEFAAIHTLQGMVMIFIGVLLLAGVDHVLGRLLRPRSPEPARQGSPPELPRLRLAAVATLLLALGCASLWLPRWEYEGSVRGSAAIPQRLGDWGSKRLVPDGNFLGSVGFSEKFSRRFERDGGEVAVFVASDFRLRRDQSLISDKIGIPGSGLLVEERDTFELGESAPSARSVVVRSPRGERRLVTYWFEGVASPWVEIARSILGLDRSPLRRDGVARAVRLDTPIAPGPRGRAEAEERLRELARLLRVELDKNPHQPVAHAPVASPEVTSG